MEDLNEQGAPHWQPQRKGLDQVIDLVVEDLFEGVGGAWNRLLSRLRQTPSQPTENGAPEAIDTKEHRNVADKEVVVPENEILRVSKTFPIALKGDLAGAIALQIEHLVPLKSDEVAFVYEKDKAPSDQSVLAIHISIVRRAFLDPLIAETSDTSAPVKIVVPSAQDGQTPITLWESEALQKRTQTRRLILLLGLLCFALAWMVSNALEARWEKVEAAWQTEIGEVQLRANEARALAEDIAEFEAEAKVLDSLVPGDELSQVLARLTDLLPDSVYLTKLDLHDGTLLLEGSLTGPVDLEAIFASVHWLEVKAHSKTDEEQPSFQLTAEVL